MAKRQKEYAKRLRQKLLEELGNRCPCGATEDLTFDHKYPEDKVGYSQAKGSDSRMYEYRKLASLGRIQILCRSCNTRKGRLSQADIDEMIASERKIYV